MPLYEYSCDRHGLFTEMLSISNRNQLASCPTCGKAAARIVSAPKLALMSTANRQAWERNEKSAHEPSIKRKHSCNHDSHNGSCAHNHQAKYKRASSNSRPWMLGH